MIRLRTAPDVSQQIFRGNERPWSESRQRLLAGLPGHRADTEPNVPLTSTTFLVVCVLAAVALPVATLVLWSRTRGPAGLRCGPAARPHRALSGDRAGLGGHRRQQLLLLLLLWSDLLGRSQAGPINSLGAAPGAVPATMTAESRAIVRARQAGNQVSGGGLVLNQTFVGSRTGLRTPALVYLPPQYFEARYAHTKFPVVLLFPGYPGNPPIYFTQLPIDRIMQTEVAAGRAKPFVVVVVKETPLAPRDTECANVPNGPQVETFLSQEVRDQVTKVLRVRTEAIHRPAEPARLQLRIAGLSGSRSTRW